MNSFFQKSYSLFFLLALKTILAGGQAVTIDNLSVKVTSGLTLTVQGDFKNQNAGTVDNSGTITVSGNWTNNASNNVFSTSSGDVQLIGTLAQNITGTNPTSFYNLTLNNSYGSVPNFVMGSNLSVLNTLTFTAGEVNLSNDTITLGSSTASTGTLSYAGGWMYGGTFKRWFNTSTIADGSVKGLFPIGTVSNYRPLYISFPSVAPLTGGTINVNQIGTTGNTSVSFLDINVTIDRIYNAYWDVKTANGLTGGIYNLRAGGTGFSGVTDYTQLRMLLAGSSVGNYGTNTGSNANPTVIRTGLTAIELNNHHQIGYPAAAALPIELLSFDARPKDSEVFVNWLTASEINTDYFSVERSPDGVIFESIGTVRAAGNSTHFLSYSFVDNDPLSGSSFYRLKETDFDGYTSFSLPVELQFKRVQNELVIKSVNRSEDQLAVTFYSPVDQEIEISFYDCIGKLFFFKNQHLTSGYQTILLPFEHIAAGMHLLTVRTPYQLLSKKIM